MLTQGVFARTNSNTNTERVCLRGQNPWRQRAIQPTSRGALLLLCRGAAFGFSINEFRFQWPSIPKLALSPARGGEGGWALMWESSQAFCPHCPAQSSPLPQSVGVGQVLVMGSKATMRKGGWDGGCSRGLVGLWACKVLIWNLWAVSVWLPEVQWGRF